MSIDFSMPPRERGRRVPPPDIPPSSEAQGLPGYYRAARYEKEEQTQAPYRRIEQIVFDTPGLASYRMLLGHAPRRLDWHIIALGDKPEEQVIAQIEETLASGHQVEISEEVLTELNRRLPESVPPE